MPGRRAVERSSSDRSGAAGVAVLPPCLEHDHGGTGLQWDEQVSRFYSANGKVELVFLAANERGAEERLDRLAQAINDQRNITGDESAIAGCRARVVFVG